MSTVERVTLKPLTSLRFVAALSVFAWHAPAINRVAYLFGAGYAGVGFFFLLSGFILTYAYHVSFGDGVSTATVRSFYIARFARVYPLHLVALAFTVVVLSLIGSVDTWNVSFEQQALQVATQVLLIQAWVPMWSIFFGANAPAWSISVEVLFYVTFPLLAFLGARYVAPLRGARILIIAAAIWVGVTAGAATQYATDNEWRLYILPLARLPDFVVGMLLGYAFLRPERTASPLRATSWEALLIVALPLAMAVSSWLPTSLRFSAWMMPWLGAAVLLFAHGRGEFSRLLSQPLFVRLGEISYAFYLTHLTVILAVEHILHDSPVALRILASLTITLGVSFMLFHLVEAPARRLIRLALLNNTKPLQRREVARSSAL